MKTFEEIYAENRVRLHRLAFRMVDDRDSASDIVQEVFIALYEKVSKGESVLYLETWLYRATVNKCLDYLKRRNRRSTLDGLQEMPAEETTQEQSEQTSMVRQVLQRMKPSERVLLVLYSEGFSYKEISETTGVRFSSVGKTLSRSLEKMEQQLKRHGYETL